ncbi:hypothetical protein AXG93_2091s1100 [Marchantia polymorpha subsp. ruderalis]|uniref:Germin-like protein n=1 Tax=Marchantia polymorpha subsp. ruderalis TaxID=1480154 RepID=A0A176W7J8_MARPO|nr:hypothetical protein AXG93_2091s1100 [Marchantia polymorpha subsp. ruderalis]
MLGSIGDSTPRTPFFMDASPSPDEFPYVLAKTKHSKQDYRGAYRKVRASDPELTSDFAVPAGSDAASVNASFFTSTMFRNATADPSLAPFGTARRVDLTNFPALDGLGISATIFVFLPGTVNPPHVHPRASEVVFVVDGNLDIGFVDTTNTLRTQSLKQGDLFVIPRGLVHFQINRGAVTATAFNTFSSSNAGISSLPTALFGSSKPISDDILEKSFGVSASTIKTLKDAQA